MSRPYSIGCRQCKKHLWIAHAHGEEQILFNNVPPAMMALRKFLFEHEDHELVFSEDSTFDGPEWEELEDRQYAEDTT